MVLMDEVEVMKEHNTADMITMHAIGHARQLLRDLERLWRTRRPASKVRMATLERLLENAMTHPAFADARFKQRSTR